MTVFEQLNDQLLKVNKNRNDFMKILFGPKSNVIFVRISALLYSRAEILKKITLLFGPNDVVIKSIRFLLTFSLLKKSLSHLKDHDMQFLRVQSNPTAQIWGLHTMAFQ
jgi:hypothetical protein